MPYPSAADPARNPHRAGAGWTLGTVTTILQNPRYTGRQVWNRHDRTSAMAPEPAWPKNTYVREDKRLPHLPALRLLLTSPSTRARRRTRGGSDVRAAVNPGEVFGYLPEHEITLTWDPVAMALQARATAGRQEHGHLHPHR